MKIKSPAALREASESELGLIGKVRFMIGEAAIFSGNRVKRHSTNIISHRQAFIEPSSPILRLPFPSYFIAYLMVCCLFFYLSHHRANNDPNDLTLPLSLNLQSLLLERTIHFFLFTETVGEIKIPLLRYSDFSSWLIFFDVRHILTPYPFHRRGY